MSRREPFGLCVFLLIVAGLVTGCSTFQAKKEVNLAPFAENAINIVSDIELGLIKARTIYTRPFVDGPAVATYTEAWQQMDELLRGIVAYSVEVVTISQSKMKEQDQAAALARYLEYMAEKGAESGSQRTILTPADIDTVLADVRSQEKLLDGLKAAQVVVDEVERIAEDELSQLGDLLDAAREEVADKITAQHDDVLSFRDDLRRGQVMTFESIRLLAHLNRGQTGYADSLFTHDPQLTQYVKDVRRPTLDELRAIEDRLVFRLKAYKMLRDEITPEMELYAKEMMELDDLVFAGRNSIRQARGAVTIWRRSHQTMAAGITSPAAIDLFGVARSALKTAVPLP